MPNPKFDADRAAAIIVDAELLTATEAASKWKVSEMTISRYRARLETDPDLLRLVIEKRAALQHLFPDPHKPTVDEVLGEVLNFVHRAAQEADHTDPDAIHAVMGAYKVIKEVQLAEKSLDVYLAALTSGPAQSSHEHPTGDQRPARQRSTSQA